MVRQVRDGGIPLTFGAIVFIVMTTWHSGVDAIRIRLVTMTEPPEKFLEGLKRTEFRACPAQPSF
jgi:KUP system potassium uptake protein